MGDKELIIRRFARSYESYNKLAVVQNQIAQRLALKLREYLVEPSCGVEIGSGTGFLTRWLVEYYPNCKWLANDLVKGSKGYMPVGVDFVEGDGEFLELPQGFVGVDLVVSASTVQWFSDLGSFVKRTANNLNDKGLVAISTFGNENFFEITKTTGQSLNYLTKRELEECFRGFEILHYEQWTQKLLFNSPIEVLQHIKATGVNAISDNRWTASRLKRFCEEYIEHFSEPTLTFNPIILIARKNG